MTKINYLRWYNNGKEQGGKKMARRLYDEHGNEVRVRKRGGCLKWFGIGLVLFFVFSVIASMGEESNTPSTPQSVSVASTEQPAEQEVEEIAEQAEIDKPEDNVPTEYKNALKKGESYAKTMHMSKRGIFEQLTSEYGEGFPEDAAQYAIDNLDIDWNENALRKAKSYYENMAMSRDSVYEQLISEYGEKFTPEQAQYAVDNLN